MFLFSWILALLLIQFILYILLWQLKDHTGLDCIVLICFKSYLMNRIQKFLFENGTQMQNGTQHLSRGVPQGSVLDPVLFLIYMLPIGDLIKNHKINFHFYADDPQTSSS